MRKLLSKINFLRALLFTIVIMPSTALAASFTSMFGGTCSDYACWIDKVWAWALTAMIPLSVLVTAVAGVIYMTSAGNPDRVSLAKKMIIGVLSGLGLIVLSRILLTFVIGVDNPL